MRLTRSSSSVLVEKQLVALHFGLYASAEYLRRHLPGKALRTGDTASLAYLDWTAAGANYRAKNG